MPRDHFGFKVPWSVAELNRLLGVVARLPEEFAHPSAAVDGLPARRWWTALLLTLLDTGLRVDEPLRVAPEAFHGDRLACGPFVYELRPETIEALRQLHACPAAAPAPDAGPPRLFPWRLDRGRGPFHMLFRAYKTILFRAELPYAAADLFHRLSVTSLNADAIFELLSLDLEYRPQEGKPTFERARGRRLKKLRETVAPKPNGKRKDPLPHVATLTINSPRSLTKILEEFIRLVGGGDKKNRDSYSTMIRQLSWFLGHTPTTYDLCDDLADGFKMWRLAQDRSPSTVKGDLALLLSLWRFAYRKRHTELLPRDVTMPRLPKRIPEAWSDVQMGMILRACCQQTGMIGELPAGEFWPLCVLLFYDTGLRLEALFKLRTSLLDLDSGALMVPFKTQKQKADQVLFLHPETLALLRATSVADRELLLPSPHTANTLRELYTVILRRAGLPHGPRDKFHKLRRTHATYVADTCGEEVARQQLGHSSVSQTRLSYIDTRKVHQRVRVAEMIPRPEWRLLEGETRT